MQKFKELLELSLRKLPKGYYGELQEDPTLGLVYVVLKGSKKQKVMLVTKDGDEKVYAEIAPQIQKIAKAEAQMAFDGVE